MISFLKYRNVILIGTLILIALFIIQKSCVKYNEGLETNNLTKKEQAATTKIKTMRDEINALKLNLDQANEKLETAQKSRDALNSQVETKQIAIDKIQNELDVANVNKAI